MFLDALSDTVLRRSPHEIVGAFLIAVVAALAASSLYMLLRRKFSDPLVLVAGITLAASAACMSVTATYLQTNGAATRDGSGITGFSAAGVPHGNMKQPPFPGPGPMHAPWHGAAGMPSTGFLMVMVADTNHDHVVSADEATAFVRSAGSANGSIDAQSIDTAVLKSLSHAPRAVIDAARESATPTPPVAASS